MVWTKPESCGAGAGNRLKAQFKSGISSVGDLLVDTYADVSFGAACALAKYKGVADPAISKGLKPGLKITYDTTGPWFKYWQTRWILEQLFLL